MRRSRQHDGKHEQGHPGERERQARAGPLGEQPGEPGAGNEEMPASAIVIESVRARRPMPETSVSQVRPEVQMKAVAS